MKKQEFEKKCEQKFEKGEKYVRKYLYCKPVYCISIPAGRFRLV
jgi:hypothetical protein